MRISQVIEKLIAYHPPIDESHTADVVKFGDPEQECTGIVTTVYASVDVIRKAAELGANLIIAHEPLFFSDPDDQEWLEQNETYQEKAKLLRDAGIVVWRDHDHIHGGPPKRMPEHMDMIFYGIMKELGWEDYCVGFQNKPLLYELPQAIPARELAQELLEKFHLTGARVVGNLDAEVKKVFFCEHINGAHWGGRDADKEAVREIEEGGYDALIPLEIVDWTLSEYVRDSAQLGRGKVLIEMGHFNTEELAMKHMARWLPEVLNDPVPVHFVQSGDSFQYVLKEG